MTRNTITYRGIDFFVERDDDYIHTFGKKGRYLYFKRLGNLYPCFYPDDILLKDMGVKACKLTDKQIVIRSYGLLENKEIFA